MKEVSKVDKKLFTVSRVIIDGDIMLKGSVISQRSDNSVTLSMGTYLGGIRFMKNLEKEGDPDRRATEDEAELYRGLAGELVGLVRLHFRKQLILGHLHRKEYRCFKHVSYNKQSVFQKKYRI